jgi:hypothetical protein
LKNFEAFLLEVEPLFEARETVFICQKLLLCIGFVPKENYNVTALLELKTNWQHLGYRSVFIYEDQWLYKSDIVKNRILVLLGKGKTIFGRKTTVQKIDAVKARQFFDQYHLQGFVAARSYLGLLYQHNIVAVASFSGGRNMRQKATHYRSYELLRFASIDSTVVVGGLSKLLKHFVAKRQPNDIMTYTDSAWGLGASFETIGFCFVENTKAIENYLDSKTMQRYHKINANSGIAVEKIYLLPSQKWILALTK